VVYPGTGGQVVKSYKTRDLARADVFDYIKFFTTEPCATVICGGISPEAIESASF